MSHPLLIRVVVTSLAFCVTVFLPLKRICYLLASIVTLLGQWPQSSSWIAPLTHNIQSRANRGEASIYDLAQGTLGDWWGFSTGLFPLAACQNFTPLFAAQKPLGALLSRGGAYLPAYSLHTSSLTGLPNFYTRSPAVHYKTARQPSYLRVATFKFNPLRSDEAVRNSAISPPWTTKTLPRVLVILGGDRDREIAAANYFVREQQLFAPDAHVLLSSGALSPEALVNSSSLSGELLEQDSKAVDTLSNFTVLVELLLRRNIRFIAVATSPYHFRRAMAIAKVVLGSSNIRFLGVSVKHPNALQKPKESLFRVARDVLRALFWVLTDFDGQSLVRCLKRAKGEL